MEQVILAVAHGIDKTIIYKTNDIIARSAIHAKIDGSQWNDITKVLKLKPFGATNASSDKYANEAQELESEADYWIDLEDPTSWEETLT